MKRIFITFCATIIATANQLLASTRPLSECKSKTSESECPEGCYWSDTPILYTEPSSDPSGSGSATSEEIRCWGFNEYYITQGTCPPGGFISGDTNKTCESCTTGGYKNGFTSTKNNTSCDECPAPLKTNNNHSKCYNRYELTFKQTKEDCSYCSGVGVNCSNTESTIKQYYEIEYKGGKYAISGCTSGDANNTANLDPNAMIPTITRNNNKCNIPTHWTAKNPEISITPGVSCQTEIANIILSNGEPNTNLLTDITLQTEWTTPSFTIKYFAAEFDNGITMTGIKTITGTLAEQYNFLPYTDIKPDYDSNTSCEHFSGWICTSTSTVAGCDGKKIHQPGDNIPMPKQGTTISIHPKTMWPDNGYYCDNNNKRTACPAGMTSTFDSSSGITRQSDCYIDYENVKFCDNTKSCFSLKDLGITGLYHNK